MAIFYRLQGDKLAVQKHFNKEGIWSKSGQRNFGTKHFMGQDGIKKGFIETVLTSI